MDYKKSKNLLKTMISLKIHILEDELNLCATFQGYKLVLYRRLFLIKEWMNIAYPFDN